MQVRIRWYPFREIFPRITRKIILAKRNEIGAFKFNQFQLEKKLRPREFRGLVIHKEDGADIYYEGEWARDKDDVKEGRCIEFTKKKVGESSLFEGYVRNGKRNGQGRIIFDNGDY